MNAMTENMRSMMRDIVSGMDTLSEASGQLTTVSETMAEVAKDNQGRSDAVAAATER